MKFTFHGGVHPESRKELSRDVPLRLFDPKGEMVYPLSQHIGKPARAIVKKGDAVLVGQRIAEAEGFVSAHIYSSCSGTVKAIEKRRTMFGRLQDSIVIDNDGQFTPADDFTTRRDISGITNDEILQRIQDAGIVGLGGAGFPTSVKLAIKDIEQAEYFVINGAECEPYITSDTRTMLDFTDLVERGARRIADFLKPKAVYFGIENNKPEAIKILSDRFKNDKSIIVKSLPPMYPQGGEKVLIFNTTGRVVPEGKLPLDVGVVIMNVTTLANIEQYIETGMPLVSKLVTVDGSAVKEPKNVFVPIGAPIADVVDFCGGYST